MNPTIIKRDRVQVAANPVPVGAKAHASHAAAHGAAGAHAGDAKSVRLLEHDGRVRAIELTCSCGEVTVIELDYPAAAGPQSPKPGTQPGPPTGHGPVPPEVPA